MLKLTTNNIINSFLLVNRSKAWESIKYVLNLTSRHEATVFYTTVNFTLTPKSIANLFNNYFLKICFPDPPIIKKVKNVPIRQPLSITVNKLAIKINNLSASRTTGIDNINVKILKLASDSILEPLFHCLNLSGNAQKSLLYIIMVTNFCQP